jgi:hypothetical protein
MPALSSIRRRLGDQGGFTMIIAMGVMVVVMMLSAAAFAAANGDIRIGLANDQQKSAYAAAEAGINDYLFRLNQDQAFWRRCDGTLPNGTKDSTWNTPWIGQAWDGKTPAKDPRNWNTLPNSSAQYTIEMLPVAGKTKCDPADPDGSMIDQATGTFRIRATGRASATSTVKRSIVATFKRKGFLDYIYYTDKEDQAPNIWANIYSCASTTSGAAPTCFSTGSADGKQPTLGTWGATQCEKYWRDGRGSASYPGQIYLPANASTYSSSNARYNYKAGGWFDYPVSCGEIVFGATEHIDGPLHTNDSLNICDNAGKPTFGRDANDFIEVTAQPSQSPERASPGCGDSWNMLGTWSPGAEPLDPPPSNASLKSDANFLFTGTTQIVFNSNGTMTVKNGQTTNGTVTTNTYTVPTNAVIYVQSANCGRLYDPYNPQVFDGTPAMAGGCGDVSVSGTYTQNVTIGADDDVVVTDDLVHPSTVDAMMGLIGDNNVRVAHLASWSSSGTGQCTSALCTSGSQGGLQVGTPKCTNSGSATSGLILQAAILALNGSFTVDRYYCGAGLGKLNVTGAIAQGHRGVVGVGNGTTGFTKNYVYDDRLKYRSPPKFLDPVNSGWRVARQVEQSPAT